MLGKAMRFATVCTLAFAICGKASRDKVAPVSKGTTECCPEDAKMAANSEQKNSHQEQERDQAEQDNLYLKRVKGLNHIRKLVGSRTELRLPRIVVVGDQSSGKSSALESLTGILFPVKAGICTKAAIVAECHRDEGLHEDRFEIFEPQMQRFTHVKLEMLPFKITEIQAELLQGKKVCTEEITVRVSGPQQMDIIVIDLPGIIHTGDGKEETRELINTYIKHPETLIMLVSEATRNDETMEAIDMAKKVDPAGKRTLRVLTKFDNFDSDDSKRTAVELVMKNRPDTGRPGDGINLSPHAVVCKPKGEDQQYRSEEENEMLRNSGLALERAGVESLKKRLPPIFAELIQTNLQHMRESIESEVCRLQLELAHIGAKPACSAFMITRCQQALLNAEKALREAVSVDLREFKEAVHQREQDVKEEWVCDKLKEDLFTCVLFQGAEALRECTQVVQSWWAPLLQTYMRGAQARALEILGAALKEVHGVPEGLRQVVCTCMERFFHDELFKAFYKCCQDAFEKEVDWGTVNHYFASKYDAERKLPDSLVEEFVNAIREEEQAYGALSADRIEDLLLERKNMFEERFKSLSMHEQQQQRLFHAVQAWYSVEKKTFTDVVCKATKTHLLEAQRQWAQSRLLGDEEIQGAAVEDEYTHGERERIMDLLKRLDQCLEEVRVMM